MPGRRRSSVGSQQEHGLDFLNLCVEVTFDRGVSTHSSFEGSSGLSRPDGGRPEPSKQSAELWAQRDPSKPATDSSELRQASAVILQSVVIVRAIGYTALFTIVGPVIVFVVASVAFVGDFHIEVLAAYFFTFLAGSALAFSELQARLSTGVKVSCKVLIPTLLGPVVFMLLAILFVPCPFNLTCLFSAVVVALFIPVCLRWFVSPARSLQNIVNFVVAMTFSAIPAVLALALMYLSLQTDLYGRWDIYFLMLSIWTFCPMVVRGPGAFLWIKASPADRFLSPLMFKLYCDLVIGVFAVFIFTRSPAQIMGFSLTTVPVMMLYIFRGTRCGLSIERLCKRTGAQDLSLPVARASIVIEAFTAVSARAITCTLLMCLAVARHFLGTTAANHPRLLPSSPSFPAFALSNFSEFAPTMAEFPVCALAFVLLWIIFAGFCWVAHRVWQADTEAPQVCPYSEAIAEAPASGSRVGEVVDCEADAYSSNASSWTRLQRTSEPASRFVLDNSSLQSGAPGVPHYRSKSYDDKCDDRWTPWGGIVQGVERGDGWLEMGDGVFVPFKIDGEVVLRQAPTENAQTPSKGMRASIAVSASPIAIMLTLIELTGGEMTAMLALTIAEAIGTAHLAFAAHNTCS